MVKLTYKSAKIIKDNFLVHVQLIFSVFCHICIQSHNISYEIVAIQNFSKQSCFVGLSTIYKELPFLTKVEHFLANHIVGLFSHTMLLLVQFLANHIVGLFSHYALIGPISSQPYSWIVPILCSYSSNFQPIIQLDCSHTMLLLVQFTELDLLYQL